MGSATAQEMAVAVLRHPAGPRQMGFPGASRPGRLGCWIDVQHEFRAVHDYLSSYRREVSVLCSHDDFFAIAVELQ